MRFLTRGKATAPTENKSSLITVLVRGDECTQSDTCSKKKQRKKRAHVKQTTEEENRNSRE